MTAWFAGCRGMKGRPSLPLAISDVRENRICVALGSPAMTAPSAPTRDIGFGIVGIGMIAEFHAQAIAQTNGGRVVAVASRDAAKAGAFAGKHGVAAAMTDVAELVARPDVNVVCVTTPSGAHLEPALAAICAGKHVVIEKPLEITLDRVDRILRAADAAHVIVAPIFQARFGEGARMLKAALEAGRFGRLVLASAYVKWHRPASYYTGWKGTLSLDGGGAVINQAIHAVDQLQWLAGMPAQVFAFKTRRVHTGIEAEDTAVAALRFHDGALGTIEASTALWPGWSRRIEIGGELGSAVLEDDRVVKWDFREARPADDAIRASGLANVLGSGASNPAAISTEGHRRQFQDLIEAIRSGRAPALDGREGRKAVALVRALYESAERGTAINLG
jgi:UDP-N-acetyl-2-amino-2-deoxyglucuronate dehydrogenase